MHSQACSSDWQGKDATWAFVVTRRPQPQESKSFVSFITCKQEARPNITKWTPALMAGVEAGHSENKMNRSSLLVRHLIPSKYAPKAFKEHLTLKEYYKGSSVFTLL